MEFPSLERPHSGKNDAGGLLRLIALPVGDLVADDGYSMVFGVPHGELEYLLRDVEQPGLVRLPRFLQ